MIKARKSKVFGAVFRRYNRFMLRRHFFKIHLSGLEHIAELNRSEPMIFFGNHCSWWDGLIEYFLSTEVLDVDCFLMMEEKQMKRYRFFRKIGAFSVNRDSPREAVASMRYAAGLFNRPNRVLWIYPQGKILPADVRPLGFYSGIGRIIQMTGRAVQTVPFVRRYELLMEQRPEVFIAFGLPQTIQSEENPKTLTQQLQARLTEMLDELRCRITQQNQLGFHDILVGRRSANELFDQIRCT